MNTPLPSRLSTLAAALLLGATLLAPLAPAHAADTAAYVAALNEFLRGNEGAEAAIDAAAEQFNKLSQAEPNDPVLRAYAGASTSMRARTTLLPWKKMGHAEDGLAQIDKALALLTPQHDAPGYRGVPASLETRFTAAGTFLALPSMFNRQARGAKLLDEVAKSPLLDGSPLPFKAAVWLRAGQEAAKGQNAAEARQWFEKVVASGAPQAAAAQAKLKEL
ncbi:hypothetical protein HLB44_17730 [Aquincola sp. S2]|uniref:Tetratricopeptide repeat protein n=1 Tax=Pseudaquabacterium terrae TaxID=2732868 RepID=A0ABX2EJS4_9BURK|nr:hypothetical protein [Aquabacterium terrae]NRF68836.1 hypothetical protein [Aquabacterium terrae]